MKFEKKLSAINCTQNQCNCNGDHSCVTDTMLLSSHYLYLKYDSKNNIASMRRFPPHEKEARQKLKKTILHLCDKQPEPKSYLWFYFNYELITSMIQAIKPHAALV